MSTFKTKEQYLNYISAWKLATNAEEAKSKRVVCDHVQYNWSYHGWTDEEVARFEDLGYKVAKHSYTIKDGGHYKDHGWISAEHYIFHNIMRGKDPKRGFTPKLHRKLAEYESPWYGFVSAAHRLEMVINEARFYVDTLGKGKKPLNSYSLAKFITPFDGGGTIIANLAKIDKEELANTRKFHR